MKFIKKNPSSLLRPFVKHYWYFELTEKDIPCAQLFFPYGSFELIFYLKGRVLMKYINGKESFFQPASFYSGQFTLPYELTFNEPCKCVGVSFYPWVGNVIYNIPSDEFTDRMVDVNILEKNNTLYEQLCETAEDSEWLRIFETYLKSKLPHFDYDEVSCHIANHILENPERNQLNKCLSSIGLSRRRIQQRFTEATGLPMSLFLRKFRFQKSIHSLDKRNDELNLTQVGLMSGYYDQAHFINEFKSFTGISPNEFTRQQSTLKEFFKSLTVAD